MRIAFFGTGDFAIPSLKLLNGKNDIIAVVTTPPRPQGRGKKILPSPVEKTARELNLKILTPENPNSESFVKIFRNFSPECGVVVDYGFILKEPLLKIPRYGFINLHPSLLPRYRGPAPIQRQLIDGCTETGVTVIAMSLEVDSGDILNQLRVPIEPEETAGELALKLAKLGAELVQTTITQIEQGSLSRSPQDHSRATKAPKITPQDRLIDWHNSAREIHNRIRALSPLPAAWTTFREKRILLLRSKIISDIEQPKTQNPPGTVLINLPGVIVVTGNGFLELVQLKPAGGKVITGKEFRNGFRLISGERFDG
ncbi:MAG: methionyl-tRNA formyltransferase [candidate division WOR-3 bacterium]